MSPFPSLLAFLHCTLERPQRVNGNSCQTASFCSHNKAPENIAAGSRKLGAGCWEAPAPAAPDPAATLEGLGAQQALLQHWGDWDVLVEEPGPVSAPGSLGTRGPGLHSSAREMDASISLVARIPAQPPALPGKERGLLVLHPPLRAKKRQQRIGTRKSSSALATSCSRCAGQGFSGDQVRRQLREAKQAGAELCLHGNPQQPLVRPGAAGPEQGSESPRDTPLGHRQIWAPSSLQSQRPYSSHSTALNPLPSSSLRTPEQPPPPPPPEHPLHGAPAPAPLLPHSHPGCASSSAGFRIKRLSAGARTWLPGC
ncbi:uncharacterized protein LOC129736924 [Falco cherrug]|uniref:uncharacterized protein LOC129736924 n=1 Tax=Falco cherrug TaxID=345164 RepID=UPI00247B0E83|nr:uncharacterized protein LOC129736924 [Falco cherrug]